MPNYVRMVMNTFYEIFNFKELNMKFESEYSLWETNNRIDLVLLINDLPIAFFQFHENNTNHNTMEAIEKDKFLGDYCKIISAPYIIIYEKNFDSYFHEQIIISLKKVIYNVMKLSSIQMDLEYTFLNIFENNSLSGLTNHDTIWNLLELNKKAIVNKEKISLTEFHKKVLMDETFIIGEDSKKELEELFIQENVLYEVSVSKDDILIDYSFNKMKN